MPVRQSYLSQQIEWFVCSRPAWRGNTIANE
uniref:Uncharacterized protein n=1 Tax=Anguilla anguilla TaxID=7936 RepID=A0A0E9QEJ6_ANGAN